MSGIKQPPYYMHMSQVRPYLVHLVPCGCPKAVGWQGGLGGDALWPHTALVLEQPCAIVCVAQLLEAVGVAHVTLRRIASCRQSLHGNTTLKPNIAYNIIIIILHIVVTVVTVMTTIVFVIYRYASQC